VTQNINLKELERKAWRSVFQDGLWDIYLGLLLLDMAILTLVSGSDAPVSKPWGYGIYIALLVLSMAILWAGKKLITMPRMGRVKFGPKGQARRKKARLVLAFSVIVGLVMFVIAWLAIRGEWSQGLPIAIIFPAVWAVNMLVVFSLGAYFLEFERLYLVGVMYALPVPVDILLDELAGIKLGFIAFAVPAAVILIMGLVVFIRFLRDYPALAGSPPVEGAFDGNG